MAFDTYMQIASRPRNGRRLRFALLAVAGVVALRHRRPALSFPCHGRRRRSSRTPPPETSGSLFRELRPPGTRAEAGARIAARSAARRAAKTRETGATARRAQAVRPGQRYIDLSEVQLRIGEAQPEQDWYQDGRLTKMAEGCALRPGVSIIPAKLITAINSEIEGQVVAESTSTVYSPDVGYENKPLVQQGRGSSACSTRASEASTSAAGASTSGGPR